MKTVIKGAVVMLVILCGVFVGAAQDKLRTVSKSQTVSNEPIEVVKIAIGEKTLNKDFQTRAERNWLKNITLSVKNISVKPIVYLNVNLRVPKQGKMIAQMLIPMSFGELPLVSFSEYVANRQAQRKTLSPNEVAKISVPVQIANVVNEQLLEQEVDVESVEFVYDFVVFEDGLAWSQGVKMQQDSDNPRNWVIVGASHRTINDRPAEDNLFTSALQSWRHGYTFLLPDQVFF